VDVNRSHAEFQGPAAQPLSVTCCPGRSVAEFRDKPYVFLSFYLVKLNPFWSEAKDPAIDALRAP
jgi:hypothetical protein